MGANGGQRPHGAPATPHPPPFCASPLSPRCATQGWEGGRPAPSSYLRRSAARTALLASTLRSLFLHRLPPPPPPPFRRARAGTAAAEMQPRRGRHRPLRLRTEGRGGAATSVAGEERMRRTAVRGSGGPSRPRRRAPPREAAAGQFPRCGHATRSAHVQSPALAAGRAAHAPEWEAGPRTPAAEHDGNSLPGVALLPPFVLSWRPERVGGYFLPPSGCPYWFILLLVGLLLFLLILVSLISLLRCCLPSSPRSPAEGPVSSVGLWCGCGALLHHRAGPG